MLFKKEKSHPKDRPFRHNPSPPQNRETRDREHQYERLFPVAVWIMGIVSCYTTAVGLQPMLNSMILSYAMAISLSLFLIAIALQFPKAYRLNMQGRYILGYSFVAIFSVLLNFNAIYGVFTAEKLLYDELKTNKSRLTAIQAEAKSALDGYYSATNVEEELVAARARLEEEKTNPRDYGYGEKARKINTEQVIPLSAQLETIEKRYYPVIQEIDSTVSHAQVIIDEALASKDLMLYREAVDKSIDAYTYVGEITHNTVSDSQFSYTPIEFAHRDVGNLDHSLWTLASLHKMEGREAAAVLVSLLLAILIDFIVLFVLIILHQGEESTSGNPELKRDDRITPTPPQNIDRRSIFSNGNSDKAESENSLSSIYASRQAVNDSHTQNGHDDASPVYASRTPASQADRAYTKNAAPDDSELEKDNLQSASFSDKEKPYPQNRSTSSIELEDVLEDTHPTDDQVQESQDQFDESYRKPSFHSTTNQKDDEQEVEEIFDETDLEDKERRADFIEGTREDEDVETVPNEDGRVSQKRLGTYSSGRKLLMPPQKGQKRTFSDINQRN